MRTLSMATKDFTVNKLQFASVGMVGREKEMQQLRDTLNEHVMVNKKEECSVRNSNRKSHLVIIDGNSGTGKTTLANSIEPVVQRLNNSKSSSANGGMVVRGKFDPLLQSDEPYSGITAACTEFINIVLRRRQSNTSNKNAENNVAAFTSQLIAAMGDDWTLLVQMVPLFEQLVQVEKPETTKVSPGWPSMESLDNAKNRFHHAFQRFLQVATSHFHPLIVILDDLQWADASSLDLIEEMLQREEFSVFCIGLHRSSMAAQDGDHLFLRTISKLENLRHNQRVSVSRISLGNFSPEAVHIFLQELFNMDEVEASSRELTALSQTCHAKTGGNVFFLIQFLSMLQYSGYLTYNFGSMKWLWESIETIKANTDSTDNVVELVLDRMYHLDDMQQQQFEVTCRRHGDTATYRQLLRLAACLGSSFSKRMLKILWREIHKSSQLSLDQRERFEAKDDADAVAALGVDGDKDCRDNISSTLELSLSKLEGEGFILRLSGQINGAEATDCNEVGMYRWVHDKIREAAILLTPADELNTWKHWIGETLAKQLESDELDASIFVVTNLLNHPDGNPCGLNESKAIWLANLNLRASQRAGTLAAFESSRDYASKGIEYIPREHRWGRFNDMTQGLYTNLIKSERLCGQTYEMEHHCTELLNSQERHIKKVAAYTNLVSGIFQDDQDGRAQEAIDIGFGSLAHLGCHFPRYSVGITMKTLLGVAYLSSLKKRLSKGESTRLGWMTEPLEKAESTKILYVLSDVLYLAHDPRFPLVICRYIEYTFEYGLTVYAPFFFAMGGAILAGVLNDLQGGALFARFALDLLERVQHRPIEASTKFVAYSLVLLWSVPVRDCRKQMKLAYDVALRTGDRSYSAWCILQYIIFSAQTGIALDTLETDCRHYLCQMRKYNLNSTSDFLPSILIFVMTMLGKSVENDPELDLLLGDRSVPKLDKMSVSQYKQIDHFAILWTRKMLPTYLGDYETCADWAMKCKDSVQKAFPGSPPSMLDVPVRALSCAAVARRTGSRCLRKEARRLRAKVKGWVRQKNPNVVHWEAILDAEFACLSPRKDTGKVASCFEKAVTLATRSGFLPDAALFNLRWAEFVLEVEGDFAEAKFRFSQAINLYEEWGALGSVHRIKVALSKLGDQHSTETDIA